MLIALSWLPEMVRLSERGITGANVRFFPRPLECQARPCTLDSLYRLRRNGTLLDIQGVACPRISSSLATTKIAFWAQVVPPRGYADCSSSNVSIYCSGPDAFTPEQETENLRQHPYILSLGLVPGGLGLTDEN